MMWRKITTTFAGVWLVFSATSIAQPLECADNIWQASETVATISVAAATSPSPSSEAGQSGRLEPYTVTVLPRIVIWDTGTDDHAARDLAAQPAVSQALDKLAPGNAFSEEALAAAQQAIIAALGREGYAYANVTPQLTSSDATGSVAVTFNVKRGPRARVRKVGITGNTVTREDVVRREILQPENDWYDPQRVEESVQRLLQTGYFANVVASSTPVDGNLTLVDINIQVIEKTGLKLQFGGGYSSAEHAVAHAGVSYPNVAGSGHDLSADLGFGQTFQRVNLSESNRWFTDSGIGRTTRLYHQAGEPLRYLSGSRFRTSGTGLGVRFDIPVNAENAAYIEPGIEHDRLSTDDLTPQAYQDYVQRFGRAANAATLITGWTYDSRDSAGFAMHGLLAQGQVEFGLGLQYVKTVVAFRYYYPLFKETVLSLALRGSAGAAVGWRDYPLQKLDYAGGTDSVRGYVANSLGARDVRTGDPLGGRRALTGSIQATNVVSQLSDHGRIVSFAFVDGGNVWGAPGSDATHTTTADGARFSYGIGLGWQIPFGTLGASVARPVTRHEGDRYQQFQVNFEAAF
jgi:outer membrane protein insertion porin family